MKMNLTNAKTPAEYLACFDGWQRKRSAALHATVTEAAAELEVWLKWGHIVYFLDGPAVLVRVEPSRVLSGSGEVSACATSNRVFVRGEVRDGHA